jgi:hypothetical protein
MVLSFFPSCFLPRYSYFSFHIFFFISSSLSNSSFPPSSPLTAWTLHCYSGNIRSQLKEYQDCVLKGRLHWSVNRHRKPHTSVHLLTGHRDTWNTRSAFKEFLKRFHLTLCWQVNYRLIGIGGHRILNWGKKRSGVMRRECGLIPELNCVTCSVKTILPTAFVALSQLLRTVPAATNIFQKKGVTLQMIWCFAACKWKHNRDNKEVNNLHVDFL